MSLADELKLGKHIDVRKKTIVHLMYIGDYILNEINTALKPYQISNQQYNVLRILRGQKGNPVSLSDVQSRMIHKNSNTTRLIDKLEVKKLVKREVDTTNRRKVKIQITKEGLSTLTKLDPIIDHLEAEILKRMELKDHDVLNEYLEKIRIE